jgi:hypothetical protein
MLCCEAVGCSIAGIGGGLYRVISGLKGYGQAAIRQLFDWLVTGQVLPMNPAAFVRGPKYVVRRVRTPVLSAEETRALLDSIDIGFHCRTS